MNNKITASFEMLLSTLIWGFGFVATTWALKSVDTVTLSVFRFSVACVLGLLILYCLNMKFHINRNHFMQSCGPGLLLGLMLFTQTWGLELTSVTNSGFITTLYVIFVPIIEMLFFRTRAQPILVLWIALSLLGTSFMLRISEISLNPGDLLTLACAIFGAAQIVWVSRVSNKITSSFAFNVFQSFWGAVVSILCWPLYQKFYFHAPDFKGIIGILSVTVGSTLIAFALQIKAQRVLPAVTAGLFFLLESPFAMFFAVVLMEEKVHTTQGLGALLIFVSAIGATLTLGKNK